MLYDVMIMLIFDYVSNNPTIGVGTSEGYEFKWYNYVNFSAILWFYIYRKSDECFLFIFL